MRRFLATTLSVVLLLEPAAAFAATRTWDGGGSDNNWSTAANWSDNTVPKGGDIILFDGTGKKDSIVDAAFGGSGSELRMTSSNTGTITVGRALTVNGNLSLSGGTLQINGGNTVTVKGSWQNGGGTFTSNTGTVLLTGSGTNYTVKETAAFKNLSLNDGLLGYWRFDEEDGVIALDSSGNGTNGTLTNGPTRVTSVPLLNYTNIHGITFDGINDVVAFGASSQLYNFERTDRFSISLWAKPAVANRAGSMISRLQIASPFPGWKFKVESNGQFVFFLINNISTNLIQVTSTVGYSVGSWQHVTLTYDGSSTAAGIKLYVDGVAVPLTINNDSLSASTKQNGFGLLSGADTFNVEPYSGSLDDIRIYNRALSHSEVQTLASGNQGTGSGRYTLGSNLTVNGNLNIYSGNLDASTSNYSITASGSFVNNATFTPRSGTVTLSGIGTNLKTYGTSLYNLAVSASKSVILRTAATITNALTVNTSSSLTLNGNDLTATNATIANSGTLTEGTGAILHTASLSVSPSSLSIGSSVTVTLTDGDENTDGTTRETVTVTVDGSSFTLTETTVNSGVFQGTVATAHGAPTGDNSTIENNDRCGFFISVQYTDNQDGTDTEFAQAEVTNSAVPCEVSAGGGGGGGGRTIQRTSPSTSSFRPAAPAAPATPPKNAELCNDVSTTTKSRAAMQVAALCRRRDIILRKALSASAPTEQKRLDAVSNFILGVIARLKARM